MDKRWPLWRDSFGLFICSTLFVYFLNWSRSFESNDAYRTSAPIYSCILYCIFHYEVRMMLLILSPSFSLYSTKSTECEINVSHIEHASAATHTAHISDSLEFNWIVLANWIWSVLPFETTENKCIKIEMICRWGWRDSRLVKVFIGRVKRAQAKH